MVRRSGKQVDSFYVSKEWREVRAKRLKMDSYTCTECGGFCGGRKRGQPSPHVDHIKTLRDHPELALDINNLRTLCGPCHSRRTRLEESGRPQIGPDGYPIEESPDPLARYRDHFKSN
jgi:5-methylcytosine-specific restriction endonuclease McrA